MKTALALMTTSRRLLSWERDNPRQREALTVIKINDKEVVDTFDVYKVRGTVGAEAFGPVVCPTEDDVRETMRALDGPVVTVQTHYVTEEEPVTLEELVDA